MDKETNAAAGGELRGCGDGPGPLDLSGLDGRDRTKVLLAVATRFSAGLARYVDTSACDGLSYPRLRLLDALHDRGPSKMSELATGLGLSPRNMTALVDALEQAGLVERRPHPSDRRATLVTLTAVGEGAAERLVDPTLTALGRLFADLSDDDEQRLVDLLVRLTGAMDAAAGVAAADPAGAKAAGPP